MKELIMLKTAQKVQENAANTTQYCNIPTPSSTNSYLLPPIFREKFLSFLMNATYQA
jgi:hypothetical protein